MPYGGITTKPLASSNVYKGITPTQPLPAGAKVTTLSAAAGGGAFNQGPDMDTLINTGHTTYAGMPAKAGFQRNDIVPVSLGGSNTSKANLQYQPAKEAAYRDNVEKYALGQYKAGKLPLQAARTMVLNWRNNDIPGQPAYDKQFGGPQNVLSNTIKELPEQLGAITGATTAQPKMFASSNDLVGQGAMDVANAAYGGSGTSPLTALEGAAKIGTGLGGMGFSFVPGSAQIMALLNKAIDFVGKGLEKTPYPEAINNSINYFTGQGSNNPQTDTTDRVLTDISNLGGTAMAILGASGIKGPIKAADIPPETMAKLAQHPDIVAAAQKLSESAKAVPPEAQAPIQKVIDTATQPKAPVASETAPGATVEPKVGEVSPELQPLAKEAPQTGTPSPYTSLPKETGLSTIASRSEAINKPIQTGGEITPSKSVTIDNMKEHLSPTEFQAFKDSTAHEKANRVEQANKAANFVKDHADHADNIIFKGEHPPEGIRTQDVFTEARIKALNDYKAGNVPLNTYLKYVKADELLGSRTGSELGARANRFDANDPASWLAKAREKLQGSDVKYAKENVTRAVKSAKATISKTAARTIEYDKILESITC